MVRLLAPVLSAALAQVSPSPPQAPPVGLFTYADVALTGGPLDAQARLAGEFLLAIPDDDLLHGFRTRAGQPAPGKPMGGWYDPGDFAGAHAFGQFVSALARMYANTGDERFREKAARLVHGFHETFGPDGFFYSSEKARKDWACYIYDKNCTGMRDAYTLAGNAEALVVLREMTDWAEKNLPRRNDEWYTLSENFYKCHELTGEARYLRLAKEYDFRDGYFDVFAKGGDGFRTDRHAYSHVNALSSGARAFIATGDRLYLDAITGAWDRLVRTQSYASGGWGPDERFILPDSGADPRGLVASLARTHHHFETVCGTYATVNLDRYLLSLTGDPKYADHMERVVFNGMLAALPPQSDGRAFYYSDYSPGATKGYFRERWPCCAGTYGLNAADYPLDIYAHDDKGPIVLLFASSRLEWAVDGTKVRIDQSTKFPEKFSTSLLVTCETPKDFTLRIRVPSWAAENPLVQVNGRSVKNEAVPGTFLTLDRRWRSGDQVTLTFAALLRFQPVSSRSPGPSALMYGPLMLVALAEGEVSITYSQDKYGFKPVPDMPGAFTLAGVTFVPFYRVTTERYTAYVSVKTVSD